MATLVQMIINILTSIQTFFDESLQLKRVAAESDRLSDLVEKPQNAARWKLSVGFDPSDLQLKTKLTFIEESLSKREDEALEKDCIVDEISELAEEVRKKAAENLKENKVSFDQLSEYQYNIQTTMHRMMALVSELSLTQVNKYVHVYILKKNWKICSHLQ